MSCDNEVIDLTESYTLAVHRHLADEIIELDDSFASPSHGSKTSKAKKVLKGIKKSPSVNKVKKDKNKTNVSSSKDTEENRRDSIWGLCPICWDRLGRNPVASTKCGHVYCLMCLEKSLKIEKKCPSCRKVLKGAHAYHPLYLN